MKQGLFTWFGYVRPLKERFELIRHAGFDTVCTWWDDTFSNTDGPKEAQCELAKKAGLTIEHSHLSYYGCDALWKSSANGDDLCRRYINDVVSASKSGIDTLVFHPYDKVSDFWDKEWAFFYPRMLKIADAAYKYGVRIAVENLRESQMTRKIIDSFSFNPNIGLCFDSGHANITEPNDFSLITERPEKLFALHLHDNDTVKDQHLLPFEGTIDWKAFIKALLSTKYSGSFMLEACYPFDFDSYTKEYAEPKEPILHYLSRAKHSCEKALEKV
ncbi:MAG: sugar phosphate isomerase/epimerase [Christensenellaceae bacterium]|nr:sugar phosphate isomerase/epimerase [Christensenellaceae bacterium]